MASDIAGSISRLSSHLTANYLSSSGWLRQMTDPHAKPRNYAVVIMVISSRAAAAATVFSFCRRLYYLLHQGKKEEMHQT
jgi:hypothetical protein